MLRSEDLFSDATTTVQTVADFLALPPYEITELRPRNVGSYKASMDPQIRHRLIEYFAPHNARLYEYLGRDMEWSK